jgi:hypothetical protein
LLVSDVTDMGLDGPVKFREIGAATAGSADGAVFFGASSGISAAAAIEGGMEPESVHAFADLWGAAEFLRTESRAGDLCLLRCGMTDHAERIYFSLIGTVNCRKRECGREYLCDHCRERIGE